MAVAVDERLRGQIIEQRPRILEIRCIEALGKPIVNIGNHRTAFLTAALICQQRREAHRRAELTHFCVEVPRCRNCPLKAVLSFGGVRRVLPQQELAS